MQGPANTRPANGAYCNLQKLIDCRHAAGKLQLAQRRKALSMLAGPNKTNFRGRGIEFEEVRAYQPGDDIRTIDWRVTARTGTAHTKMFREERERPVLVCVDQRSNMFFGSRNCCKSVLAAELSALLTWAALENGDRIGGLVLGINGHSETRPRRSRRSVLGLLNQITEMNHALPGTDHERETDFNTLLLELRRVARPGSSLFIVSDFDGALEQVALESIYQLSRHMQITALHCSDLLEQQLPDAGRYTVTDGSSRARLETGVADIRERFSDEFDRRFFELRDHYGRLGIPVIRATTADAPLGLLQSYFGEERGKQ